MALAVIITEPAKFRTNRRRVLAQAIADTSYPTGGYPITAAMFGLQRIDDVDCRSSQSRLWTWDSANSKLQVSTAQGTEATNASNQNLQACIVEVVGV